MSILRPVNIPNFSDGQRNVETLRFITCGSVGTGKSTLIGRLLCESKAIFDNQSQSRDTGSCQHGTDCEEIDSVWLVDRQQTGLEQGTNIDFAYHFFATNRRNYIVADNSGHEKYTRNMVTAAAAADLAVILIDARKGVQTQTRRHSRIVAMMGIHRVVLAVNMMDLIGFKEDTFNAIAEDYRCFAAGLAFVSIQTIPLSGLNGDNVRRSSDNIPWYSGPSLMEFLDGAEMRKTSERKAFRMPVKWVNRPNPEFREFCGRIAEGSIRAGDAIRMLPSGMRTRVKAVLSGFDEVEAAHVGDTVNLTLIDELDACRGDVLVAADTPPEVADQFEVKLLWLSEHPMVPGRQYLMNLACKEVVATITEIKYREDVNTGAHLAAKMLAMNEIATANLSTSAPVVYEPFTVNRTLGAFILIDRMTFETVGAGTVDFALRRASNIHWQTLELNSAVRAMQKHQTPRCIWFTGLSGSGKSTIANLLDQRLYADGKHTYLLDGDNVRHGLNRDLGFTEADRVENIRRVAEVAKLMVDAGLIVLVSFISPFRSERRMARSLFSEGEFVEVFVDAPIEECERRDVKGLYAKARRGDLKNFTGIDSPYEVPESPDIHLHTAASATESCVEQILTALR